jgi:hypothetical protein
MRGKRLFVIPCNGEGANRSRWLALAVRPTFALTAFRSLVQGSPPMGSGGFDMEMPPFGGCF